MRTFIGSAVLALVVAGGLGGELRAQGCNGGGFNGYAPQAYAYPQAALQYYYAPPAAPQFYYGGQQDYGGYCVGPYCQPAWAPQQRSYYAPPAYRYGDGYAYGGYGGPAYRGIFVGAARSR